MSNVQIEPKNQQIFIWKLDLGVGYWILTPGPAKRAWRIEHGA